MDPKASVSIQRPSPASASAPRPSLEALIEQSQSPNVLAAKALQERFEASGLQLVNKVQAFNARASQREDEDEDDLMDGMGSRNGRRVPVTADPQIVNLDVATQIAYLRKLKFQYLEQNAKDKYVKSIVSDIDDAPIVTAEQNKELGLVNEEKKERLKAAKAQLAEVQHNIRLLAPLVEEDYMKVKNATERATLLSQKIVEARQQLLLLRQTHPQPRLTVALAEDKLQDQITEMQEVSDEVGAAKQRAKEERSKLRALAGELEAVRIEAAEKEREVKAMQVDEEDERLMPLYDWFTTSLTLQRKLSDLEDSVAVSENELHLTYRISTSSRPRSVRIALIFAPDTRRLAEAEVSGVKDLGLDMTELITERVAVNDVHGLVATVLMRARAAAAEL